MYNYSRAIGANMSLCCNYDFNTGEYEISFGRNKFFTTCDISDALMYKIKALYGDRLDIGDCTILSHLCHLYFSINYDNLFSKFCLNIDFVGHDSPPYPIDDVSNIIYGCYHAFPDYFKNRFILSIDFHTKKIVEAFIGNPDFCFEFVSLLYDYGHKYMKNRGLL